MKRRREDVDCGCGDESWTTSLLEYVEDDYDNDGDGDENEDGFDEDYEDDDDEKKERERLRTMKNESKNPESSWIGNFACCKKTVLWGPREGNEQDHSAEYWNYC